MKLQATYYIHVLFKLFALWKYLFSLKLCCLLMCFRPEVIECLSGEVRQAVVKETDHKISENCRAQLKVEKLRQVTFEICEHPGGTRVQAWTWILNSSVGIVYWYSHVSFGKYMLFSNKN